MSVCRISVLIVIALVCGAYAQTEPFSSRNVCPTAGGPPPCKDSDGDGLCDSWERAERLPGGARLPNSDPDKPDVYVQYDWMGYGPMETGCHVQMEFVNASTLMTRLLSSPTARVDLWHWMLSRRASAITESISTSSVVTNCPILTSFPNGF